MEAMTPRALLSRAAGVTNVYRGWWIVLTGFLTLVFHGGSTTYVYSVMLPAMEDDLGWSRTTLVGVLTLGAFVSAAAGMVMGPVFDRRGARGGMVAGAAVGGLFLVLAGLVQSPWQYYALIGVGHAIARPALETLGPRTAIAQWFVRKRPFAYAAFSGGRAVSGIILVPIIAWVISVAGWRIGWVVLGVLVWVVVLPMSAVWVRRRPEDMGLHPDGDPVRPPSQERSNAPVRPAEPVWRGRDALRSPTFWMISGGMVLAMFPTAGIFVHLVPYFEEHGLSRAAAAWGVSLFALGAIAGRPLWAWLAIRFGIRGALTMFGLGYGFSVIAFALLDPGWAVVGAAVAVGLTNGGAMQLQAQAWPDYFGRGIVGLLTGVSIALVTPTIAFAPLAAAIVHDRVGDYTPVWLAYGAAGFGAAALFALTPRPKITGRGQ